MTIVVDVTIPVAVNVKMAHVDVADYTISRYHNLTILNCNKHNTQCTPQNHFKIKKWKHLFLISEN